MSSNEAADPVDQGDDAPRPYGNRFEGESHGRHRRVCDCILTADDGHPLASSLDLHTDAPDERDPSWIAIREEVRRASSDKREVFAPARTLPRELWDQLSALPPELGELIEVKRLLLYGSALTSIPPEIGRMTALESFEPYTSYGLHWFPYEITRCANLRASTVSTRAIYGNEKTRLPFPHLSALPVGMVPGTCSVCDRPVDGVALQRWITLRVATDDLPLLVHACSESCITSLPPPAEGHGDRPHVGGPELEQPRGSYW